MHRSEQSQTFSNQTHASRFNETEKMQHDADYYTKKYEWERRNLITLKGVEANLSNEVTALKDSVAKLQKDSNEGEIKLMSTKMRNLQKQVDINDKKYNEAMGEIEQLQKEINTLRQEKTLCQKNLKGINGEINKADEEISHLVNEIESSQNTSKMNQNMMLNLKMKNEEDKSNYYRRLNELNKELKDPRLTKASRLKTEMNAIQNDTATILKHRLTKLIINNREKVKLIDNYQRNMKVIDEAFNTIKEATGLTEIEEIQDTFIKGEEQNYNLITYVDVLNQEIDSIVDSNHTMKIKTEALRMEHAEKKRILAGTPDDEKRSRQVEEYIQSKKKEVKEFQTMLNEVQPDVKEVLTRLANSKFNRQNPHKIQEYQSSGVILNDANLGEYLSELEDYTNKILIYKGRAKNQENEEIFAKALLLEELSPKEFKKKVYDHSPLYGVLEDNKEKGKGIERLLDREQLEEMARRDLERTKAEAKGRKK